MTQTAATQTAATTTTTLVLKLRRAGTDLAGVDHTWHVDTPTAADAAAHLALLRNDAREVTATLTTADGRWLGTGRAGHGTVNTSWAA